MFNRRITDDAVSPVVGELLMVAIAVILAALVFVIAFTIFSSLPEANIIGVTAQQESPDLITIKYWGGQDDDRLAYLRVFAPNNTPFYTSDAGGTLSMGYGPGVKPDIGAQIYLHHNSSEALWEGNQHVVVVGVFDDDSQKIVLDKIV